MLFNARRLSFLIVGLLLLEVLIYIWALYTTEADFVTDKCARNSGRVSSLLHFTALIVIARSGLSKVFTGHELFNALRALLTLYTLNHLIHLFHVVRNFRHHHLELSLAENLHGAITFGCILLVPVILWSSLRWNRWWITLLVLHLCNVSWFIMETFWSKVKPEHPAYHNQFGMWVIGATTIVVLFRLMQYLLDRRSLPLLHDR